MKGFALELEMTVLLLEQFYTGIIGVLVDDRRFRVAIDQSLVIVQRRGIVVSVGVPLKDVARSDVDQ
jgi:hypothetical protein